MWKWKWGIKLGVERWNTGSGHLEGKKHNRLSDKYVPFKVYYKGLEENSVALHMETVHKIYTRTKRINNQYHNFREHVWNMDIVVHIIWIKEDLAGIFNKHLDYNTFIYWSRNYLQWLTLTRIFEEVWEYSKTYCGNIVNLEQYPIYGLFGPKRKNCNSTITTSLSYSSWGNRPHYSSIWSTLIKKCV